MEMQNYYKSTNDSVDPAMKKTFMSTRSLEDSDEQIYSFDEKKRKKSKSKKIVVSSGQGHISIKA